MKSLTYLEARQLYLDHLKEHGHAIIPSASLVPENDPTVLFVNSGMFPLVPFLLGEAHPEGTRLADVQRCIRTIDIEEVGDHSHLTAFEMIGNWSLNDYFKEEAIKISVGYYVDKLGFDINKIYVSVFEGNEDVPMDEDAVEIWKKVFADYGIDAQVGRDQRIQPHPKSENWWELDGGGPCGPDSEMFYDMGVEPTVEDSNVASDGVKYVEIGNNVFMQYLKEGGEYKPLGRHNVDFGGGLDRIAMILQGVDNVYQVDIYKPIYDQVKELASNDIENSIRIIVDHIKAATWMIADGVVPGRTQREYILRRLIRRAIRHGRKLGIEGEFTRKVGEVAIEQFKPVHENLEPRKDEILNILEEEERKFNLTVEKGLREVEGLTKNGEKVFTNEDGASFKLYETYGFPPEMLLEELSTRGIEVNEETFWANHNKAYEEHQSKSRTAAKGMFKGGLADTSEGSTKLHTATHLLLAALYKTLGDHIYQKGSNITPDRLRLDFPNDEKLTNEQIKRVEEMVNAQIEAGLEVTWEEMPKDKALELVPYAAFSERYGEMVKVYWMGGKETPFSVEICNGPHVSNTRELGRFKIVKQENVGAGIKRIKAILE
ncbi:MAG: alanine--tRNA ligase [Candidatus Dojkabacteria bacterium]|nr:MAG: alanine--tRNA ligase [Candidatus Dojkabacteria bacterium]